MAKVIGYIDAFNLYHGLRDRYQNRYQWLDLVKLVERLRPSDSVIAVRYFTALVRDDPPAGGDAAGGRPAEVVGDPRAAGGRARSISLSKLSGSVADQWIERDRPAGP